MMRIFITGATGNIGKTVIKHLNKNYDNLQIIAGVRNPKKSVNSFNEFSNVTLEHFDFEDSNTYENNLDGFDRVFLLRPPQISDVDIFKPLISSLKKAGVKHIVFLSVQGVEKSSIIPHNKIEKLIKESDLNYIFIRPSYFMQNLTTTLSNEIKNKRSITLPSKKAKFNWIDIENIGEVAAKFLVEFDQFKNQAFELTGEENLSFGQAVEIINKTASTNINYKSINPVRFYFMKKNEGIEKGFALVMTILHFLPRFQKEPIISNNYEKLLHKKPTRLAEFVEREKEFFTNS